MKTYFNWLRELVGVALDLECAGGRRFSPNKVTGDLYFDLWEQLKARYGVGNF